MNPFQTRSTIVTFLFELSVMSRVTDGVFYHSVRLYDRYCSKRVVLKDQAKLVVATCLWLAAKTWGGCNHIINNVSVPTGGRFYGPNPRARIPRLSELVHYCGGSDVFDESMFIQMERHILDTLSWDIYEPMINDYVLNVDENCLIQYELYKRQLEHNKEWSEKRQSQSSTDSDATANEQDLEEDEDLEMKIQLINLKRFLIDLTAWQYPLLKFEMFEVCQGIFGVLDKFTNHEQGPFLMIPPSSSSDQAQLLNIFINAIIRAPNSLLEIYKNHSGISPFINRVKEYHAELQKKLELASAMDLSRRSNMSTTTVGGRYFDNTSSPSSLYSSQGYTPLRNTSMHSDNSLFSTAGAEQSSPITPQMYTFNQFKTGSDCGSTLSVNSLSNNNSVHQEMEQDTRKRIIGSEEDKENLVPINSAPQVTKFINKSFGSPSTTIRNNNSNSRVSLSSLPIGNATSIV
ncbi:hypothetical protein Kpol_1060p19 [Vanderwaltozyma polyspora DSM 70294]|uniref:G1/S-specific cyclin n=1 Tax=Vanderwaltozyma polyspora (strain ATCC 22028 / DSM 70294 / BCRC 21397 / CBS 2163 / NBRC 10782 / NRRL Y-8283 / UCD 57-17) TaxID=436907 RepID=A7TK17_VANPO|nr:uncharacterized protein Kpol_1060p19 [Vanderwaltozyma polyspora DSM 70294]EDO17363.1 hypothetical protein Kpol_1060p19 [Vanderwaltozyma polyspora DSM 70294]